MKQTILALCALAFACTMLSSCGEDYLDNDVIGRVAEPDYAANSGNLKETTTTVTLPDSVEGIPDKSSRLADILSK